MVTVKLIPGARQSKAGWTPVVRIFQDKRPIGSKTALLPMATREAAEAHSIRAANDVARNTRALDVVVSIPPTRATAPMPAASAALVLIEREISAMLAMPLPGTVRNTRVLQVQI